MFADLVPYRLYNFRTIYVDDFGFLKELVDAPQTDREVVLLVLHHFLVFPKVRLENLEQREDRALLQWVAHWGISYLGPSVPSEGIVSFADFRVALSRRMRYLSRYSASLLPAKPDPWFIRLGRTLLQFALFPILLPIAFIQRRRWK